MQAHMAETFRASVISVLGAPPDPAPLEPVMLDGQVESGFRREHIKFQVSPGDYSYAHLLIPNGLISPAPAIYLYHRHSNDFKIGKDEMIGLAGNKVYALGRDLVRRGYVVFAPDAVGFGERRSPASDGSAYDLAFNYHQLALRLLRGETLLKKILWDVSRGIDYLETRTEVNSSLIGIMGCDMGGRMALWSAALDPRLRLGVAHEGVISYREYIKRGNWFEAEMVVPRLMQVADMHHILSLVAPRPFLLSTGSEQSGDISDTYQKSRPVYEKYGAGNRLTLFRYSAQPEMTSEMRGNAFTWLDSWLKPDTAMPGGPKKD